MLIVVREVQLLKVWSPIVVTEAGMLIELRALQL